MKKKKTPNNRFCSSALSRLFPPQIMTAQNSFKVMSRQKTGSYLFIFKKWYLMGSDRCTYISKHVCLEKKSALKCNYSSTIIFPLPHNKLHVGGALLLAAYWSGKDQKHHNSPQNY